MALHGTRKYTHKKLRFRLVPLGEMFPMFTSTIALRNRTTSSDCQSPVSLSLSMKDSSNHARTRPTVTFNTLGGDMSWMCTL